MKDRYMVQIMTEDVRRGEYVNLRIAGWWLYDWKEKKTVQTFPRSQEKEARGLCKLLNSIEEENDGLSK
jgi:hypothetical protein